MLWEGERLVYSGLSIPRCRALVIGSGALFSLHLTIGGDCPFSCKSIPLS